MPILDSPVSSSRPLELDDALADRRSARPDPDRALSRAAESRGRVGAFFLAAWLVAAAWPLAVGAERAAEEPAETSSISPSGADPSGAETLAMPAAGPGHASTEQTSTTQHSITIDGDTVSYTATAGTLILREEDGTAKASIFYVAYTRNGVRDPAERPLTFAFNGGPGSSSVWLHLGLLGPRRVLMDDDGRPLPPPYRLVENESSLLDVTDLVFIDPVTTGYSRAVPGQDPSQFHGVEEDVISVGDFVRLWTSRNARWSSPKFLLGESYGTTRAAGLSGYLQRRHGMFLNGVVLVSSILDFITVEADSANDLPHLLHLPSFAATAWYHGRLSPELQNRDLRGLLDEVEAFALGEYASALLRGRRLGAEETRAVADKLASYTGLDPEYVLRSRLRVPIERFTKELLRDRGRTVGRLDSRFRGEDGDPTAADFDSDPSYSAILGPYTATLNDYLRRELELEIDLPYEILTSRVHPWKVGERFEGRYISVSDTLRDAMHRNPDLQVFVANGYYDLATPYFATEYTFDHLALDPASSDRVTMTYYEAGHMMYIHEPSLAALRDDLVAFYATAAGGE